MATKLMHGEQEVNEQSPNVAWTVEHVFYKKPCCRKTIKLMLNFGQISIENVSINFINLVD